MKQNIIFTSKICDFFTGAEGEGVYTADRGTYPENLAEFEQMRKYTPPRVSEDGAVSKELSDLMPKSFYYAPIGEDAIFSSTVFSYENEKITHVIKCKKSDEFYPIECFDSKSFISSLDAVFGGEYLPDITLVPGNGMNVNKVMKFLSSTGRAEIFTRLISAVLECKREKKRIIICDEPENVVLWIASVCYALPKKLSDTLSFCTYTFNPDDIDADICGVLPVGTAYKYDDYAKRYTVFDMFDGVLKDIGSEQYFGFISDSMRHDYNLVSDFNGFITDGFYFTEPCYEITSAYEIYKLIKKGVQNVLKAGLDSCVEILVKSNPIAQIECAERLCGDIDDVCALDDIASVILCFKIMCIPYKNCSRFLKEQIKEAICHAVFVIMLNASTDESVFTSFYKRLDEITAEAGISLTDELMKDENRTKLVAILSYRSSMWKTAFAVSLLMKYIKKNGVKEGELGATEPLGTFMVDIVNSGKEANLHFDNARALITPLSPYAYLLCNAYERCTSALSSLSDGDKNIEKLREVFATLASSAQLENRNIVFKHFAHLEDYKTLYSIFVAMMKAGDGKTTAQVFDEHYRDYFNLIIDYSEKYLVLGIDEYYALAAGRSGDYKLRASESIFDILSTRSIMAKCAKDCVLNICSEIEIEEPSSKDREKIIALSDYTKNVLGLKLKDKLLLLAFGVECKSIDNKKDYFDKKPILSELTQSAPVDLTSYDENDWEHYLEWILPPFTSLLLTGTEISYIYDRLKMTEEQKAEFCAEFAKEFLKDGKNESDYTSFCTYLEFLFNKCGNEEKEVVSSLVKKLNSKRIEILKANAEEAYSTKPAMLDAFYELLAMPTKKQGFLSKLFNKN